MGLALGKKADLEKLNFLPALSLKRSTKLHLNTELAFCQTLAMGWAVYHIVKMSFAKSVVLSLIFFSFQNLSPLSYPSKMDL